MNPVPIVMASGPVAQTLAPPGGGHGRLSDIAPTILAIMGLPQPAAMTGRSLLPATDLRRRATA